MKNRAAILIILSAIILGSTGSLHAACVAHALPKLSHQEFRTRVIQHFNAARFQSLLQPAPAGLFFQQQQFHNDLANRLNNALKNYYEGIYDPRDIVCIATDVGAILEADSLNTFHGTKLVLLPSPSGIPGKQDGLFGRDLELLHKLHEIIVRRSRQFRDSFPPPGACGAAVPCITRTWANSLYHEFKEAPQNFLPVPQLSYVEFPYLTGDIDSPDFNEAEISNFYHRVSAESYLDNAVGARRTVSVQIGTSKVSFTTALYDPTSLQFVSARSLLDFVEGEWITRMTPFYSDLFQNILAGSPNWEVNFGQSSSLVNSDRLFKVSQSNALPNGISNFYCASAKSSSGDLPYGELISSNKRVYLGNHIAFFCDIVMNGDAKLLGAEEIIKTDHTFPTTLPILAGESGNRDMLEQLNVLAELNIDQNDLLNDIKNLIGTEQFLNKISNLQKAIQAAEAAARGPGIGEIVNLASAVAQFYPGIGQIASGALVVASNLHGAATSSDGPAIYLLNNQEALADGSKKIGEGAANVNKLIDSIDKLSDRDRARSEVGDLRAQLEEVQKRYREFQEEIQRVSQRQQEQYLRAVEAYELLRNRRAGIVVDIQTALNEVSLKDIIGGRVVGAEPPSQRQCRQAADAFNASPNETTFGSLNGNCSRYLTAFTALADCIKSLPEDREKYVEYRANNAKIGLLLARKKGDGECLHDIRWRFQNFDP